MKKFGVVMLSGVLLLSLSIGAFAAEINSHIFTIRWAEGP